jgi:hypothetical protein
MFQHHRCIIRRINQALYYKRLESMWDQISYPLK